MVQVSMICDVMSPVSPVSPVSLVSPVSPVSPVSAVSLPHLWVLFGVILADSDQALVVDLPRLTSILSNFFSWGRVRRTKIIESEFHKK